MYFSATGGEGYFSLSFERAPGAPNSSVCSAKNCSKNPPYLFADFERIFLAILGLAILGLAAILDLAAFFLHNFT